MSQSQLGSLSHLLQDHTTHLGDFQNDYAGERHAPENWIETNDPATGEPLARVGNGTGEEIRQAVRSAKEASELWAAIAPSERGRLLKNLSAIVRREGEVLARLETRDTGKPLEQGRRDVAAAARYFEFYGSVINGFVGDTIPVEGGAFAATEHLPHGITGHIIPWNYPAQITARTVGASLAAGNAAVVKPATEAPLVALCYARLAREAGLPNGVLSVVPGGPEAGSALTGHEDVDHVSFTGSVGTGRAVARACADRGRPTLLELGGKSAHVVLDDAELARAVPVIAKSLLLHAGQTCTAGTRVIVHESLHQELVSLLAPYFRNASLGPGLEAPDVGPVVSRAQATRINGFIDRAKNENASVAAISESPLPSRGYFIRPILFDNVAQDSELFAEEVFGPVLSVTSVPSNEDAVSAAQNSRYGLTAAVWSENVDNAIHCARQLKVGQVYVNGYAPGGGVELPFGGTKDSGYGREKGAEALREYSQTRLLYLNISLGQQ